MTDSDDNGEVADQEPYTNYVKVSQELAQCKKDFANKENNYLRTLAQMKVMLEQRERYEEIHAQKSKQEDSAVAQHSHQSNGKARHLNIESLLLATN